MVFTDVTLRDGLQAESKVVPVDKKLELYRKIVGSAPERIEFTSFVHPKWIPQLADAEAFCEAVAKEKSKGPELMAFVPNSKGLERLLKFDIPWASVFIATSETFNKKNVNASIDETLEELKKVLAAAHSAGRKLRIYISTVFGCPYEGDLSDAQVMKVLKQVASLGPDEIALSDTIGVGTPSAVKRIVGAFAKEFDLKKTALHLHDTYGLAAANAFAGFESGVQSFDGSSGGIGGCPYAKGATGNVALEDLRYLFRRVGQDLKFSPAASFDATSFLEALGFSVHGKLHDILKKGGKVHGVS